jgi:hypothetical protein
MPSKRIDTRICIGIDRPPKTHLDNKVKKLYYWLVLGQKVKEQKIY